MWPQVFQSKPKALFFKALPFSPRDVSSSDENDDDRNNNDEGEGQGEGQEEEGGEGEGGQQHLTSSSSSPATPQPLRRRGRRGQSVEGLMIKNKGGLSQHEPAMEEDSHSFTFVHDPSDPVPTIGGNITSGEPLMVGGAFDQVERAGFFGCNHPGA